MRYGASNSEYDIAELHHYFGQTLDDLRWTRVNDSLQIWLTNCLVLSVQNKKVLWSGKKPLLLRTDVRTDVRMWVWVWIYVLYVSGFSAENEIGTWIVTIVELGPLFWNMQFRRLIYKAALSWFFFPSLVWSPPHPRTTLSSVCPLDRESRTMATSAAHVKFVRISLQAWYVACT